MSDHEDHALALRHGLAIQLEASTVTHLLKVAVEQCDSARSRL